MVHKVYRFIKAGDHEVSAREILNHFADEPAVNTADVQRAPGAVTVILMDDPPVAFTEKLEAGGWAGQIIWRRE